jgi:hypothetical protein
MARTADEQGEQMATIAALESLPQLYASPVASMGFRYALQHPWPVFVGAATLPIAAIVILWTCVPHPVDASASASVQADSEVGTASTATRAVNHAIVAPGRGMERGLLAAAAEEQQQQL